MSRKDEIDFLYALGITKKKGWQQSDNPCLSADYGDVEKAWTTITKTWSDEARANTLQDIELAVHAQARFRRESRAAGDKVPQPKLMASWIRMKRWMDQIESTSELKMKQAEEARKCECGKPTMGSRFATCQSCMPDPWQPYRQQFAESNDLTRKPDEPKHEWFARLKQIAKDSGRRIGK